MRNRILILLAATALLTALPLFAQTADESQTGDQAQIERYAELQAETADGTASASAEVSATTDSGSEQGQMDADINADANLEGDRELPKTAGFLPLLALLGFGSLLSALGLRVVRNNK